MEENQCYKNLNYFFNKIMFSNSKRWHRVWSKLFLTLWSLISISFALGLTPFWFPKIKNMLQNIRVLSSAITIFISKWKILFVILKKMFLKKIIFLLLAKSWAEKCPDGWDEFQGHCYMIGTNFYENAKLRTWHNAKVS